MQKLSFQLFFMFSHYYYYFYIKQYFIRHFIGWNLKIIYPANKNVLKWIENFNLF